MSEEQAERIRDLESEIENFLEMNEGMKDGFAIRVRDLESEITRLRAALRPFAQAYPASLHLLNKYDRYYGAPAQVHTGDFRRAWEALGGTIEKGLPE